MMGKAGSIRMGGVFVEIGADAKAFFATAGAVDKRLAKLGSFGVGAGLSTMFKTFNGISRSVENVGRSISGVGVKMAAMGAAVGAPLGMAIKQFASFDDAIRATAAVTGNLGPDGAAAMSMLTESARQLGATTSFTATEVANLMTELGRAGFSPTEINDMTGAVLDLSRATGTDATKSAGIMAATLRQFGLGAMDAAKAADVLTETANATFTSVEGLGESLKYAGPVAKSLGVSLEDTTAILGVLGNVGIQGSEAGTALRRLSVISAGAGEKLHDLFGVSNQDAAGQMKPLVQILDEINTATRDMPVGERTAKMAKAFGLLGITSANVLSQTAGGVVELADRLKSVDGVAAKTAKAMDSGLGGSMRLARSAVNDTAIEIGSALAPSLQTALAFIQDLANSITVFVKNNQQMVVDLAKTTALVIAGGLALAGLGAAITMVGGIIGAVLSPLGLLAAGIAALVIQSPELSAAFTTTFGEVKSIASETMTGIYDAISGGDLGGAMDIAMTGLMAAWLEGTGKLQTSFSEWSAKFLNQFTDLGTGIAVAVEGLGIDGLAASPSAFGAAPGLDQRGAVTPDELAALANKRARNISAMEASGKETIDKRLSGAKQFGADIADKTASAKSRLSSLTSKASLRRTLTSQADDLIASIGNAKSMDDLKSAADEFFALKSSGMLTAGQEKKYGESIDLAAEKLTPTGTSGVAQSAVAVKPPDKEQMQMAAMEAAGKQAEVAGTFSSVNLGGMGFGASLQQQQLDVLKGIKKNTDDIGDEGAVAA
jgi:TP901 family phage tail tape measure protein